MFLKIIRFARLALALTPLSLGLASFLSPVPALAAPAAAPANDGLPPGAPPLTAAQKKQQQARIQRFVQDSQALNSNPSLTPTQKQQQAAALQSAFQQDMLNILTPKQRAMVTAQNTKVIGLRKQFMQQHQSEISQLKEMNDKLAALNITLNKSLTPQQHQKINTIKQQAQTQLEKLQTENQPDAVKQQTAGAIYRDAQRQAFAVLTPSQQSELKTLQAKIAALQNHLNQELTTFAKAHGTQ